MVRAPCDGGCAFANLMTVGRVVQLVPCPTPVISSVDHGEIAQAREQFTVAI